MNKTEFNLQLNHFEWTKELIKHELEKFDNTKINDFDKRDYTALMFASLYHPELISDIIQHPETKPNLKNKYGMTGLMFSCQQRKMELIPKKPEILNHENADANIQDEIGRDALMHACENGSPLVYSLLNTQQVIANQQNINGKTPLMLALKNNRYNAVLDLLNSKKDVGLNKQDKVGDTALMLAGRSSSINIEYIIPKMMSKIGIDLNLENNQGETAFDVFKKHNSDAYNVDIIKALFVEEINERLINKNLKKPEKYYKNH